LGGAGVPAAASGEAGGVGGVAAGAGPKALVGAGCPSDAMTVDDSCSMVDAPLFLI
jgi:hypothetical protein